MVGWQFEWRDGEVWEVGVGRVSTGLFYGEYIWAYLPEGRQRIENLWTGERWILESGDKWLNGAYFLRGDHTFSRKNPELKIKLSTSAVVNWPRLYMFGERPVYRAWFGNTAQDARTDGVLFFADCISPCDAGLVFQKGRELYFTDGVLKDLLVGEF